jgi:transposase
MLLRITFSDVDIDALRYWRFPHPDPRLQRRMEALSWRSQGVADGDIWRLWSRSKASVHRYLHADVTGGIEALKHLQPRRPRSALHPHRATIDAAVREHPSATVAAAAVRIEALPGVARRPTQVRQFLPARGMKPRNVGMVPATADVEAPAAFKNIVWSHGEQKPGLGREPSSAWMPPLSCVPLLSGWSGVVHGCWSKRPQVGNGSRCERP